MQYLLLDLDWSSPTYLQTCLTPADKPKAGPAHPTPNPLSSGLATPPVPIGLQGWTSITPYSRHERIYTAAPSHPVDTSGLMLHVEAIEIMENAEKEEGDATFRDTVEEDPVCQAILPSPMSMSREACATFLWRFWDIPLSNDRRRVPDHVVIWESMAKKANKRRE